MSGRSIRRPTREPRVRAGAGPNWPDSAGSATPRSDGPRPRSWRTCQRSSGTKPNWWRRSPKRAISMRLDEDVLDWFRRSGPRYQTRMNAVLRMYVKRMRKHT